MMLSDIEALRTILAAWDEMNPVDAYALGISRDCLLRLRDAGYINLYSRGSCRPLAEAHATVYQYDEDQKRLEKQARDAAQKESEQNAKEKAKEHKADRLRIKDARRSWWQFALGLLIGWILGAVTPFDLINWIKSLFHG